MDIFMAVYAVISTIADLCVCLISFYLFQYMQKHDPPKLFSNNGSNKNKIAVIEPEKITKVPTTQIVSNVKSETVSIKKRNRQ